MKWSKVKKLTEATFAPALVGRIEVHSTSYNKPCSSLGRGWITVDKQELVNFSTFESAKNFGCYYHEYVNTNCLKHPGVTTEERTEGNLIEPGEFSRFDLMQTCFDFIQTNAHEALASRNPLMRMLAVMSQKMGKAKVAAAVEDEHPLVRFMALFRINASDQQDV